MSMVIEIFGLHDSSLWSGQSKPVRSTGVLKHRASVLPQTFPDFASSTWTKLVPIHAATEKHGGIASVKTLGKHLFAAL